eukprot:1159555-Pelagomonas_calceolata.AAC.4
MHAAFLAGIVSSLLPPSHELGPFEGDRCPWHFKQGAEVCLKTTGVPGTLNKVPRPMSLALWTRCQCYFVTTLIGPVHAGQAPGMGREPWVLVKFTPDSPGPPSAPPVLKLGMQAKEKVFSSTAVLVKWGGRWAKCPGTSLFGS